VCDFGRFGLKLGFEADLSGLGVNWWPRRFHRGQRGGGGRLALVHALGHHLAVIQATVLPVGRTIRWGSFTLKMLLARQNLGDGLTAQPCKTAMASSLPIDAAIMAQ
jgi:hypothetical protein